jgi:hypothetical protein
MVDGHVQLKDQVRDYAHRGDALKEWSYLDFFLGSYDGKVLKEQSTPRGRIPNKRVPYQDNCGRDGHARIIRTSGHETMPYFPGRWFARRDPENVNGLFEASMLALLKPWRLLSELKHPHETFRHTFDQFLLTAPQKIHKLITNIEFFHECSDAATTQRLSAEVAAELAFEAVNGNDIPGDEQLVQDNGSPIVDPFASIITEQEIREVTDNPYSAQELLYANVALAIGTESGALRDPPITNEEPRRSLPATDAQLHQFQVWENEIDHLKDADADGADVYDELGADDEPIVFPVHAPDEPSVSAIQPPEPASDPVFPHLNERQTMVHNIISTHLRAHLNGEHPEQLLLIAHGQGGTGKSEMLNAIAHTFDSLHANHLLAKTAMSGVAASIIGGDTLHSWAALPLTTPGCNKWLTHPNKRIHARRQHNIGGVLWLMIDEISMLTTSLLQYLSQVTGFVRGGGVNSTIPFGGICVLLLGDLHQFPPVANTSRELYHPTPISDDCRLGRDLFLQFKNVVHLEEQMRIRDATWTEILDRSRTGDCSDDDIQEIRNLVLTNPNCNIPDFSRPPWDNVILVTPRNSVRTGWNERMLLAHCRKMNQTRYIVYAEDNCRKKPLTREQRLAIAHLKVDKTNRLPNKVELAVGMKVMVLENIATDAGLANGSRGEIIDIVLDPKEPVPVISSESVYLQHPPVAVLFAPYFNRGTQLQGLPKGVVPIFPSQKSFRLGGKSGCTIARKQFALTPAYAFTDFKSQGQTIENVIIDLAKTPSGGLSGFNAYVALSRGRGRESIRLLRDFDSTLFTKHPNELLRIEDERLANLASQTIEEYNAGNFGHFPATKL